MLAAEAIAHDGMPLMGEASLLALKEHADEAYPEECIGIVLDGDRYVRLANVADNPEHVAVSDGRAITEAYARDDLRAVCHSHPDGPDCPSEQDMRSQMEMDVPWVIISTNGTATLPAFAWGDSLDDKRDLVGRLFRHGVDDCYGLIRAWYWQERGIRLDDFPRQWEWWLDQTDGEKDLYSKYFAECGFRAIDRADVRHGDVWLACVRSAVPNHGGIYLDNGLALHHAATRLAYDATRLSRREPIGRWIDGGYISHWLRYGE